MMGTPKENPLKADFVGDNRAIFDIGGDKYRLVAH
jgi:mRNA-degrading endonuclease HigB of HigAB toxin-antitoxin module